MSIKQRLARAERIIRTLAEPETVAARIAALQALHAAGYLVQDGDTWRATTGVSGHERIAELLTLARARQNRGDNGRTL